MGYISRVHIEVLAWDVFFILFFWGIIWVYRILNREEEGGRGGGDKGTSRNVGEGWEGGG